MSGSPRVLVVDDQESMRVLLTSGLRSLGIMSVSTATDGVDALHQLRAIRFDLVFLDGEMPRLNGIDTLRAIRADAELRSLPVVMVTGNADASFIHKASALGLNGYLVKPVSVSALAARIQAITQSAR